MPINRYAADYLTPSNEEIESPLLNIVTSSWLEGISEGSSKLPLLSDSIKVHKILFEWLKKSQNYSDIFPIT